jgi:hypothetical protein
MLTICKSSNSILVDGCTNEASIALPFASTNHSLYNSVSFYKNEMQHIIDQFDAARTNNKPLSFLRIIVLLIETIVVLLHS